MEGEIYRKSGKNEAIGSLSGSFKEIKLPPEKVDSSSLDYFAVEDGPDEVFFEGPAKSKTERLTQNTARFSLSQGVSRGPFAERIRKLRKAISTIVDRLGNVDK